MLIVPDVTKSEIVYLIIAFLLGLLIGFLIKNILKIGIVLLAIIILLIVIGVVSPNTVLSFIKTSVITITPEAERYATEALTYLPYNSIFFIIGLVVGLLKG
ncbi:MAG: hypothetical protein RXQ78_06365 [Sulfolobaceae archaeon]